MQMASKWSQNLKVSRTLDNIFRCVFTSFFRCSLKRYFDNVGINFSIMFVIFISFSKLDDLCKCTPRLHGNMLFDLCCTLQLFYMSMIFLLFDMLIFAPFWDRFLDAFWIVFLVNWIYVWSFVGLNNC